MQINFRKQHSNKNLRIIIFSLFFLLFVTTISLINSFYNNTDLKISKNISINDLNSISTDPIKTKQKEYNNDDIIGIITIPDTNINELILQSNDNSYYLSHDEFKNYNKYGSITMDYRIDINNTNKILIYGHNSSYVDTPFKELEKYYNEDFYKNHQYILIEFSKEVRTYEIFSVYIETSDFDYMNLNFQTSQEWQNHLTKLKDKSLYQTNKNISPNEEILILQTCSNNIEYIKYDKKYLLIISKRIK